MSFYGKKIKRQHYGVIKMCDYFFCIILEGIFKPVLVGPSFFPEVKNKSYKKIEHLMEKKFKSVPR